MKKQSLRKITAIFITSMFFVLAASLYVNAKTNLDSSPDAKIDIKGGFGIKVYMEDIRENATTALPVDIWTNFSLLIRPILFPKSVLYLHYIEDISPGKWLIYLCGCPCRLSIGRCSIEVTVGNVYNNVTGIVIGPLVLFY